MAGQLYLVGGQPGAQGQELDGDQGVEGVDDGGEDQGSSSGPEAGQAVCLPTRRALFS